MQPGPLRRQRRPAGPAGSAAGLRRWRRAHRRRGLPPPPPVPLLQACAPLAGPLSQDRPAEPWRQQQRAPFCGGLARKKTSAARGLRCSAGTERSKVGDTIATQWHPAPDICVTAGWRRRGGAGSVGQQACPPLPARISHPPFTAHQKVPFMVGSRWSRSDQKSGWLAHSTRGLAPAVQAQGCITRRRCRRAAWCGSCGCMRPGCPTACRSRPLEASAGSQRSSLFRRRRRRGRPSCQTGWRPVCSGVIVPAPAPILPPAAEAACCGGGVSVGDACTQHQASTPLRHSTGTGGKCLAGFCPGVPCASRPANERAASARHAALLSAAALAPCQRLFTVSQMQAKQRGVLHRSRA